MTGQTPAAVPVQGPAQPTYTDLIWATASSQAALDDARLSTAERLSYLKAEAATYTAAAHLGVDGGTPEHYAAELECQDLAAVSGADVDEPDAETVGPPWHPAYYDARDAGHSPDAAELIADQAQAELAQACSAGAAIQACTSAEAARTSSVAAREEAEATEPEAGL